MNNEFEYLKENLENIKKRIADAALRTGRKPEDIGLVAVTKTVDVERIKKIIEYGVENIGENRVQELCDKYGSIGNQCKWHLIGHLQTNKVKYIIDKVSLIHSLDSIELAREIQKRAHNANRIINVLVQVNVSGEESKYGLAVEQVENFIREISTFENIRVKGLMTIAPYVENPEDTRPVFRGLKKIFIDISKKNIDNIDMEYLSMGMSNDFEVAIEEGANLVRIGTALFGKRQ